MAFLDKNGLQTLTNKLVQGDAIKVASHRGHTVKNVIDNITRECENVATPNTMTLENRVSEFKVGQGRDLDVSGDVEEGKVEVELKGKTYQNLCYSKILLNSSSLSSYEIEDLEDRIRIVKNTDSIPSWTYFSNNSLKLNMIKPNTNYTLFFRYKTSTPKNISAHFMEGSATNSLCHGARAVNLYNDIYMANIKTYPSFENININGQEIYFTNAQPTNNCDWVEFYKDMILLEGDYSTIKSEELPQYFEGIKSSFEDGVVDVEVQGKNLFDAKDFCDKVNNPNACQYEDGALIVKDSSHEIGFNYNFPCYISFNIKTSDSQNTGASVLQVTTYDGSVIHLDAGINGERFKEHYVPNIKSIKLNSWARGTNILKNFQIERTQFTPYEPYYKKKISFNIGEPLRSLPNGVCDEIRNDNGRWELVRRIGKANAVDIKHWYKLATYEKTILYRWHNGTYDGKYKAKPSCSGWCNTIPYYKPKGENDTAFCRINDVGPYGALVFAIEKSKLDQDNPDPTQWFSENPTTFYYQLADPIITQIEPIEFDIKPMANIYINSGDIYPISNHTVVLNRAGQIEQGILRIAELRKRVDNLETAYDSYLLETQHKLSILGFEYELESEEI